MFELCKSIIKSFRAFRKLPLTEKALFLYTQQSASVFKPLESALSKSMPFNLCDVVRIRIANTSLYSIPLASIPSKTIMGLLLKADGHDEKALSKLLTKKKWDEIEAFEFFPVL